jgi:DNA-binding transcriptional MerR regulator
MWTMDELVERVREALAAEYSGAPNGRVRDLPDRRAIRWYTTTGLVDRPLGMRGRTALYGPRHLLQLVALKRRQAEGRTLAEIQAELAGADDEALTAAARVPESLLVPDGPLPDQPDAPARTRFWAADVVRPDVWIATEPDRRRHPPASRLPASTRPIGGVALRGGAILVLSHAPTPDDRAAIAAAAEPLLAVLAARGLLDPPEPPEPPEPPRLPSSEPHHDGRTS